MPSYTSSSGAAAGVGHAVKAEVGHAVKSVPDEARELRSKPLFQRFAHLGLGARAIIYAVLAYFATDIALTHRSSASPGASGALDELARQPAGRVIVGLLAIGLAGYGCWRFVQAVSRDTGTQDARQPFERAGWAAVGGLYFVLCGRAVALAVASGKSGSGNGQGASSNPRPWVAEVLRWPVGPLWVGLVAVVLVASAIALMAWGAVHDYSRVFDTRRMGAPRFRAAQVSGIAGEVARGLLVLLVSVYLLTAAITDNPQRANGLGPALQALVRLPAGQALLLVIALGLACFAIYSLLEALYRPA